MNQKIAIAAHLRRCPTLDMALPCHRIGRLAAGPHLRFLETCLVMLGPVRPAFAAIIEPKGLATAASGLKHLLCVFALSAGLAASEIDTGAVLNPHAIEISDRALALRWTALFQADPAWISRQVSYLAERSGHQGPTLLSARLLYAGEPWSRRGREEVHGRRWKTSDVETRLAILREIRWQRDPVYAPILAALLDRDESPEVLSSALVTLWFIDSQTAKQRATWLADPRIIPPGRSDHVPGAVHASVRQLSLALLIQSRGADDQATRSALEWVLTNTSGSERIHALNLIEVGTAQDLVRLSIMRLAQELASGSEDEDASTALAVACTRLGATLDPELADALVRIAVGGRRAVATAAASALAGNLTWSATVPTSLIAARAGNDPDPAVRHALRNLLLRVDPQRSAAGDPTSPWTELGAHRERLSRWEWERYAK